MKNRKDIEMILQIPNLTADNRAMREGELKKIELIEILDADMQEAETARYENKYHELYHLKQTLIKENTSYSIAKAFYDTINEKRPFIL